MDPAEALRQRNLASAARWRWIFVVLAIVLPVTMGALFRRQNNRLRALADHGRTTMATLSQVTRRGAATYSEYRYRVGGQTHDWSVSHADAPYEPGERFDITYLPEAPSLSRPGVYTLARFDREVNVTFQHRFIAGLCAVLHFAALLCERSVRRLRVGGTHTGASISPDMAGRAVAGLLLAVALATNLDPHVAAVMVKAFGRTAWGLPIVWTVSIVETALLAPFFWVFAHLMRIVMDAQSRGASLSKAGVLLSVAHAGPELRRSRTIVIAGFVYFAALMASWIVFANARGV